MLPIPCHESFLQAWFFVLRPVKIGVVSAETKRIRQQLYAGEYQPDHKKFVGQQHIKEVCARVSRETWTVLSSTDAAILKQCFCAHRLGLDSLRRHSMFWLLNSVPSLSENLICVIGFR